MDNKERLLEEEIKGSLRDGYLPCAIAFEIARKLKAAPRTVGNAANSAKVRIRDCQLGCFVVKKAVHGDTDSIIASEPVLERIKSALVNGRLPCAVAFKVSRELSVSLKEVGDAANKLKIRIASCQLGCFE